jgi:hypothetical protein
MICHNPDTAEYNHAPEMEKPTFCVGSSLVHHAECDFIMLLDGINLMSFSCTMEIDMAIFLRIVEIDGDSIRIIIIPKYREDTPYLAFQDRDAFLL